MPTYHGDNDAVEGDKIYCTFEKCSGISAISTGGRHRGQCQTINGNPATAIITKKWRRIN